MQIYNMMQMAFKIKKTFFNHTPSSEFSAYRLASLFNMYTVAEENKTNFWFDLSIYPEFKNTLISIGKIDDEDERLKAIRKEFNFNFEFRLGDKVKLIEFELQRGVIFGLEIKNQLERDSIEINPYHYLLNSSFKYLL